MKKLWNEVEITLFEGTCAKFRYSDTTKTTTDDDTRDVHSRLFFMEKYFFCLAHETRTNDIIMICKTSKGFEILEP